MKTTTTTTTNYTNRHRQPWLRAGHFLGRLCPKDKGKIMTIAESVCPGSAFLLVGARSRGLRFPWPASRL